MIKKNFNINKKNLFIYEAYRWHYSLDILENININFNYLDSNSGAAARIISNLLSNYINIIFSINKNILNNWNWYYMYYISNNYEKVISNKLNYSFIDNDKINLITINLKSKQLKISINSANKKIFNLTVGKVLSNLNISEKAKKKSNKGERLFIEYIINFLETKSQFFGTNKKGLLKIKYLKKASKISELLLKNLNKYFRITNIITYYNISNSYLKFKKIRSIKRRLTKKIIKNESYNLDF
uniref:Ymf61 n=1 Tax=Tetrahymena paravorax TaxID=5905 RepID=Q09F57_TETPR|nr:Ymf61 [Tetrahymena paravorax]ABI51694.1 Ymf61 [Tetrahymena paravorax]